MFIGTVRAGRILHADLVKNVLHSPMAFFDTTPVGRLLNRFGKDIDVIDTQIGHHSSWSLKTLMWIVNTFVAIGYSTPVFMSVAIPLTIVYIVIQVGA